MVVVLTGSSERLPHALKASGVVRAALFLLDLGRLVEERPRLCELSRSDRVDGEQRFCESRAAAAASSGLSSFASAFAAASIVKICSVGVELGEGEDGVAEEVGQGVQRREALLCCCGSNHLHDVRAELVAQQGANASCEREPSFHLCQVGDKRGWAHANERAELANRPRSDGHLARGAMALRVLL